MDFGLEDIDQTYPKRKPWMIILTAAVLVGIVTFLYLRRRDDENNVVADVDKPDVPAGEIVATAEVAVIVADIPEPPPAPPEPPEPPENPIADGPANAMLAKAEEAEKIGDLLGARGQYLEIIRRTTDDKVRVNAEKRLGTINIELVLSDRRMPEKKLYKVRRRDRLERIAQMHKTTQELIQRSNGIKDRNRIRAGQTLKIFTGRFSIVVSKSRNDLVLYCNGDFFKRYRVGSGKRDSTETGDFKVTLKKEKPTWYRRDGPPVKFGNKANILGTRWLAIKDIKAPQNDGRGFGIHGTWDNTSIGKYLSRGCIRMVNKEVEELYSLVPIDTRVRIVK